MQTLSTRVWIYQANRKLDPQEAGWVEDTLQRFNAQWKAHQVKLRSEAHLLYRLFIVFKVDQDQQEATGCSIDSSVHLVQQIGRELGVDFFDRQSVAYRRADGGIELTRLPELSKLVAQGFIDDATPVFDNLVDNVADFEDRWETTLGQSWLRRFA